MASLPTSTVLVFDTNVLLSATVFKKFAGELYEYCAEHYQLKISDWVLREFNDKLEQKFKLLDSDRQEIIERIEADAELVIPTNDLPTDSSDPDDNNVLRLALFVNADFLITGDQKHLLPLKQVGYTVIISPREFYDLYVA